MAPLTAKGQDQRAVEFAASALLLSADIAADRGQGRRARELRERALALTTIESGSPEMTTRVLRARASSIAAWVSAARRRPTILARAECEVC